MTPYIYRVLREARIVAQEQPDSPLAGALAQHDATAAAATKQAHLWSTMKRQSSTDEPPASRDGSLLFVPTGEQANDPLLSACYAAGMTETQVIEMLLRRSRVMEQQLTELAFADAVGPFRVASAHR